MKCSALCILSLACKAEVAKTRNGRTDEGLGVAKPGDPHRFRLSPDSDGRADTAGFLMWAKPGSRHDATSGFKLVERSVLFV